MTLKFQMVDTTRREEWNEVVHRSPKSEIFHLFEWGDLIEKTYNARLFRLVAEAEGKIVGVLPFVQFSNLLFGRKIVSFPFSDVGGFCTLDGDGNVSRSLASEFVRLARKLNVDFIEVRSFRENANDLIRMEFQEGFQAFSYRLDTSVSYDAIWKKYSKKIRHNIRKMKELGLKITEAQCESDVESFYRIYLERMKDFGTPPAPSAYWKNMWSTFYPKGMVKLIFTVLDGRPIAGFMALLFKRKLYFVLCVSLKKFWKYHGLNELLFDWYIQYACRNGYETVDFGRTRRGTGVQRFKEKGWGVERMPLCTYYFYLRGGKNNPLEIALNTETNLYAKAWRRFIPTILTPPLGHFIRKRVGDV